MIDGKVIIFGMGRIFKSLIEQFHIAKVVAITDNEENNRRDPNHIFPVITPEEIPGLEFDFIIVCTGYRVAQEIYVQLTEQLQVPDTKIISYRKYFGDISWGPCSLLKICDGVGIHTITDSVDYFYNYGILSNTNVLGQDFSHISWEKEENNQALLLPLDPNDAVLKLLPDKLHEYKELYKFVILPFHACEDICARVAVQNGYRLHYVHALDIQATIFEKQEETAIYVITHKNYNAPTEKMYHTLWVGDRKNCNIPCLTEVGDNISRLNGKINECTGLYWIWKHATVPIIGLNHYRRYFAGSNAEGLLSEEKVKILLEKYDIIVANVVFAYPLTNGEYLKQSINDKSYEKAYQIVENTIMQVHPEYKEAFDRMMNGYSFFPCNMFITRRELLNKYCEWLFSIIIPAAEKFDSTSYDDYSKRAIGFFAERLLTVWLFKQDYNIKELSITIRDTVK